MVVIPFTEFAAYSQEVTLENTAYRFSFIKNFRGGFWTFSLYDADLNPLLVGIKIVPDYELIKQYPGRGLPPGQMYCVDPAGNKKAIEDGDLEAGRFQLVYVPEGEANAV
jgi:hypothetical protein